MVAQHGIEELRAVLGHTVHVHDVRGGYVQAIGDHGVQLIFGVLTRTALVAAGVHDSATRRQRHALAVVLAVLEEVDQAEAGGQHADGLVRLSQLRQQARGIQARAVGDEPVAAIHAETLHHEREPVRQRRVGQLMPRRKQHEQRHLLTIWQDVRFEVELRVQVVELKVRMEVAALVLGPGRPA